MEFSYSFVAIKNLFMLIKMFNFILQKKKKIKRNNYLQPLIIAERELLIDLYRPSIKKTENGKREKKIRLHDL